MKLKLFFYSIQNKIAAITLGSILIGCTAAGTNSISQSVSDLQEKAIAILKDPSSPGKLQADLITAGLSAMQFASASDQQKYANEMYEVAGGLNTLVTGKVVTTDKVISTMKAFSLTASTPGYLKYVSDVGALWAQLYPYIKTSDDVKIAMNYLMAFINAANTVGAAYKTN